MPISFDVIFSIDKQENSHIRKRSGLCPEAGGDCPPGGDGPDGNPKAPVALQAGHGPMADRETNT